MSDGRRRVPSRNKMCAKKVARFHHGRGSQEGLFANAETSAQLDSLPVRSLRGNQLYTLAAMVAHNLGREIQIAA